MAANSGHHRKVI